MLLVQRAALAVALARTGGEMSARRIVLRPASMLAVRDARARTAHAHAYA
jgi:hypothetical protein